MYLVTFHHCRRFLLNQFCHSFPVLTIQLVWCEFIFWDMYRLRLWLNTVHRVTWWTAFNWDSTVQAGPTNPTGPAGSAQVNRGWGGRQFMRVCRAVLCLGLKTCGSVVIFRPVDNSNYMRMMINGNWLVSIFFFFFLRLHIWMCHPGGTVLPVQPDWAAGIVSCYQYWTQKTKLEKSQSHGKGECSCLWPPLVLLLPLHWTVESLVLP